jgi:hypothetical protein
MTWDARRFARAFNGPEKQWSSYGIIDPDGKGGPALTLVDDSGQPSPYGPMLNVTLQPSGVSVPCRVLGQVAGDGEADYYPWAAGDEVLVMLPEGDERGAPVIVGRLNQELDVWPTVVAGQDATQNKFGFRRIRAPFIVETAGGYLIRSATTGAQIGIDSTGQVILSGGERENMVLGPEALGFTSGDGETFMQAFPPSKEVYFGAGQATFLLSATETKFLSTGPISFATAGGQANQHAVTAEQIIGLLVNLLTYMAAQGFFTAGPLATAAWTALPAPGKIALIATTLKAVMDPLAGVTPYTGLAPAGMFGSLIGTLLGPTGTITTTMANPIAANDPTGSVFGFGRAGFKL